MVDVPGEFDLDADGLFGGENGFRGRVAFIGPIPGNASSRVTVSFVPVGLRILEVTMSGLDAGERRR